MNTRRKEIVPVIAITFTARLSIKYHVEYQPVNNPSSSYVRKASQQLKLSAPAFAISDDLEIRRHMGELTGISNLELGTSISLGFRDYHIPVIATHSRDFAEGCTCTGFVSRNAVVSGSYTACQNQLRLPRT
jgi:hypothetical protein